MKDRLGDLHELVPEESLPVNGHCTQWYDVEPGKRRSSPITDTTPLTKPKTTNSRLFVVAKIKIQRIRRIHRKSETEPTAFMAALRNKVKDIQSEVCEIKNNTRELTALHTAALMSVVLSDDDTTKMSGLESKSRAAGARAIKLLKEVERIDVPDESVIRRVYETQLFQARKAVAEAMDRHEVELQRYADRLRKLLLQQMAIANVSSLPCDSAEPDAFGHRPDVFTGQYLTMAEEVKTKLADATGRHDELIQLEKSIVELRDLFADVAILVNTQGDVVDSIEAHVLAAAQEVTEGRRQLKGAQKKQRSARKKKMILAGIGTGVAVGLIATMALL